MNTRTEPARRRARLTQAERTARSDAKMLDAALQLIAERGYQKTSLAAIGERAGYSRGLVGQRFGSKAGLLSALADRLTREWAVERLEPEVRGLGGLPAIRRMLDVYFATMKESNSVTRAILILTVEALGGDELVTGFFSELHGRWRRMLEGWLREGIEAGEIDPEVSPELQAVLLLATVRGVTLQVLLDPERVDIDQVAAELQRDVDRRLAPRPR